MQTILAIAAGGAIGAVLRHGVNNAFVSAGFPWGIMICNVLGSFALGMAMGLFALTAQPPTALKAFLTVGLLGAFTTFSTFSMDAVVLWERGAHMAAAGYVAGSVILAVGGLLAGMSIVKVLT